MEYETRLEAIFIHEGMLFSIDIFYENISLFSKKMVYNIDILFKGVSLWQKKERIILDLEEL